jgi:small-conductance mechanosensitive channel
MALLPLLLLAACSVETGFSEVTPTPTATVGAGLPATPLAGEETDQEEILGEKVEVVSPTPEPTATPGLIQEVISEVTTSAGLNQFRFLGLTTEDWINLLISLLLLALGLLVFIPLLYRFLHVVARRVPIRSVETLLNVFESQVKWLLGLLLVQYATDRLTLLPVDIKQWLNQLYFAIFVVILTIAAWKLLNLGLTVYQQRVATGKDRPQHQSFLSLLRGVALVILIIFGLTAVLNNYGINVTIPLAILGLVGFALSIAAQDTLVDVINGFIILSDRPFSLGDRIEIQELNTWGDVVEIGTRTTRIRTRDNRLVIIPNSKIGRNTVVNYSYPDPVYRIQTDLNIAYGSDLDQVRQVVETTIRTIKGVLADKPVDVLLLEFGDSALKVRIRWWIHSYVDTRRMLDRVHSALYQEFDRLGVEMPFPTYDINLMTNNHAGKERELP